MMGGVVSDITDNLLGLDPNGGGIYSVANDVLGSTVADDVLGMDPNGNGAIGAYNVAIPIVAAYLTGQYLAPEAAAGADAAAAGADAASSSAVTSGMLDAANATLDPIAALNAQAGWTASDLGYLADVGVTGDVIAQAAANNAALDATTSSVTQDMLDTANATSDPIASLNEQAGWTDTAAQTAGVAGAAESSSLWDSLPSLPSGLSSLLLPLASGLVAKSMFPDAKKTTTDLPSFAVTTPYSGGNGWQGGAPGYNNSSALINSAQQDLTKALSNGYMSTLLTGGRGEDESKLNTSQILLGA